MKGLSILIPVYNADVSKLVHDLHRQALLLDCPFEIVLADDCSQPEFVEINKCLVNLDGVVYEQMPQNVGRAIIRNRLAQKARFDLLVFMDCDVAMVDDFYLKRYLEQTSADVVFGGYTYKVEQKQPECMLRWTYDTTLRTLNAEQRRKNPYSAFSTVNFFIRRSLMLQYPFNEKLSVYGHEDSMLRCVLEQKGISISHIDNPVYHAHLDDNVSFLEKTRKGVENLLVINDMPECRQLTEHINLLRYYAKLRRFHLVKPLKLLYLLSNKWLVVNLMSAKPCLALFQWYKLGYLCYITK
ncbi:MAG: glycosyltransferase family 2 protein [Paludibacteraceae bacterium]|nr:glycosyltransferase family 2 protein [Paludibacteraceae bacterium]MBP3717477.1 glycosyltransferase family 2 protein [Paludibacteraceae bacterium]